MFHYDIAPNKFDRFMSWLVPELSHSKM